MQQLLIIPCGTDENRHLLAVQSLTLGCNRAITLDYQVIGS